MSFENPSFLKKKYNLQNSPEVLRAAVRYDKRKPSEEGSMINSKPEDKINNYLNRFKEISERKDEGEREMGMTALKKVLYKSLVIKEEDVPESYFRNQERLAREQGHGDIKVSEEQKKQLTEVIISDQKSSLDNWLDYLSSPDAMYPDWLKYYTIRSVSQLGKYNKEKKEFSKRNKNTTEPFIDINREALAYVLDAIIKKYEDAKGYKAKEVLENKYQEIEADNRLTDQEKEERKKEQAKFQEFLNNEDFAKLYAFAIEKVTPASKERLSDISGKWIKYERNSDHMPLVESLQGYGTGWCTAGESTAHAQLKGGDFYVYYSTDENGQPKIPRVAIRMEDDRIGEVRGIGPNQNLDPYISPVVSQKMEEFGTEGQKYQKKSADMKRLTEIDRRHKAGEDFSREDLKFLYQIDGRIEGFGYQEDPRIEELLAGRDKRNDLAYILDSKPEQISFSEEEALDSTRDIVFHYGNLFVDRIEYAQGLKLPNRINGSLVFNNLKSAEGLKLPKIVDGALSFSSLQSVKGLVLPDYIGESLSIHGVKSAKGLKLPNRVDYGISFTNLQSAEGLMLPDYIEKFLYLSSLESAKGLKLPNYVGGEINLSSLKSAKGLILPDYIGGSINLDNIQSAEGLILPERVNGELVLICLKSIKNLKLPVYIRESLFLNNLEYINGLELPEYIGGNLILSGLKSLNGLRFSKCVDKYFNLNHLEPSGGFKMPKSISGSLDLDDFYLAEDVKFPKHIGENIVFQNLPDFDMQFFRERYPHLADKVSYSIQ